MGLWGCAVRCAESEGVTVEWTLWCLPFIWWRFWVQLGYLHTAGGGVQYLQQASVGPSPKLIFLFGIPASRSYGQGMGLSDKGPVEVQIGAFSFFLFPLSWTLLVTLVSLLLSRPVPVPSARALPCPSRAVRRCSCAGGMWTPFEIAHGYAACVPRVTPGQPIRPQLTLRCRARSPRRDPGSLVSHYGDVVNNIRCARAPLEGLSLCYHRRLAAAVVDWQYRGQNTPGTNDL